MKKTEVPSDKITRDYVTILGTRITSTSKRRVIEQVQNRLSKKQRVLIVTPNPEIVNAAVSDVRLRKVINSADIAVPDGLGLIVAAKFLSLDQPDSKIFRLPVLLGHAVVIGFSVFLNKRWLTNNLQVIKGRELFGELVRLAYQEKWRVYLLGGRGDEAELTVQNFSEKYKGISIKAHAGPLLDTGAKPETIEDIQSQKQVIREIKEFKPHLIFVAFGAPKQEKWLDKWLSRLPVAAGMTVGGAFRFISGRSKLPPKVIESLGLEWFWRLVTEPWRLKRILIAVAVFPARVFWYKLNSD